MKKIGQTRKTKKPLPVFEVLFDGPQLLPESIPLGTLTQALSAIRRLATGSDSTDEDESDSLETDEASGAIRLLDVVRGSAVYRFVCPENDAAINRLRGAGRALINPEEVGEKDYILSPIERLSATARRMGCRIILREANKEDGILATIEPESFRRISEKLFITGDTSLTGHVQRVGGATSMRCALRVEFQQRLLFCSVETQEVSRQLGKLLYRDVVINGEARWIKNTWKVLDFKVKSVSQLKEKPLNEAFKALRDAGGNGWDKIDDPEAFLEGAGAR